MDELVFERLKTVFRQVFSNPLLEIKPADSAADIFGWDSLTHMTLIDAVERHFSVMFTFEEVHSLSNVADIVNLVSRKTGR